jgi:ADP-heptose:LPS heptosyltransferase
MIKNPAIYINTHALGDTLAAIPTLNKLSKSFEQPITVFTSKPDLFGGHPSVLNALPLDSDKSDYTIHETFQPLLNLNHTFDKGKSNHKFVFKHGTMDIRQFHAISIGVTLEPDEMSIDLYIEAPMDIKGLQNYVVIHPTKTWPSRTWDSNSWQDLINELNGRGIPVIAIGQRDKEWSATDNKVVYKDTIDLNIELGLNLLDAGTSIANLRWLMNRSKCVVTMDSGILHLAGTTDANIIQLGSSINHKLRAPFRKGTQSYKYKYVEGGCTKKCASDIKYYQKVHGNIHGIPPLGKCLEGYSEFKCHPTVDLVFKEIMKTKHLYV